MNHKKILYRIMFIMFLSIALTSNVYSNALTGRAEETTKPKPKILKFQKKSKEDKIKKTKKISLEEFLKKDNRYYKQNLNLDNITVLVYHHILKKEDIKGRWANNEAVISTKDFEKQMRYLYENDFNILSLEEFLRYKEKNIKPPKKSILLTFDDGYKSNFVYAYPVLKKYKFKAALFLITSMLKEKREGIFDANKLQYVSLQELNWHKDVFSYSCHTYNLHRKMLSGQSYMNSKSYIEILEDLKKSQAILKKHSDSELKNVLAYPYGAYNDKSTQALINLNFRAAFISRNAQVDKNTDLLHLTRYSISSNFDFASLMKNY